MCGFDSGKTMILATCAKVGVIPVVVLPESHSVQALNPPMDTNVARHSLSSWDISGHGCAVLEVLTWAFLSLISQVMVSSFVRVAIIDGLLCQTWEPQTQFQSLVCRNHSVCRCPFPHIPHHQRGLHRGWHGTCELMTCRHLLVPRRCFGCHQASLCELPTLDLYCSPCTCWPSVQCLHIGSTSRTWPVHSNLGAPCGVVSHCYETWGDVLQVSLYGEVPSV